MSGDVEQVLRTLIQKQAETATELRLLRVSVERGFDLGSKRIEEHGQRINALESQRDTARGWAMAATGLAGLLGLDRLASVLSRFL